MSKRKHRFVIGFTGDNQCVYGKPKDAGERDWVDPMTFKQAERQIKRRLSLATICKKAIYELVQVEER